jgi:hypothetical protein
MTPAQCRAARALIELSIHALSGAAVVSALTVWDYEAGVGHLRPADIDAIKAARAGVEFIEDGVKLRKGGK